MEEGLGGKEGDGGRMGVTGAREQGAMCVAGVTASSPVSLYLLRLINNSISITKAQVLQAWAPPPRFGHPSPPVFGGSVRERANWSSHLPRCFCDSRLGHLMPVLELGFVESGN